MQSAVTLTLSAFTQGNKVVAALVDLFQSFATEEGRVQGRGQRQVVNPAVLREALHAWSQARSQASFHVGACTIPPGTYHTPFEKNVDFSRSGRVAIEGGLAMRALLYLMKVSISPFLKRV